MPGSNSPTAGTKDVNNPFFGQVLTGIGTGIERIASELMPIWTAKQLGLQSEDQLKRELYDPEGTPAPVRVDGAVQYPDAAPRKTFGDLTIGTFSVPGGTILILAGAFLLTIYFMKKMR